jgi:hypothetical protein
MSQRQGAGALLVDQRSAERSAVGVELELLLRAVADAYRARAAVALQMLERRLAELVL